MQWFCLKLFYISLLFSTTVVASTWNPQNATLIVMGRSGAGISSTIKEILGPGAEIVSTNSSTEGSLLTEYKIETSPQHFLKILDVPGLVDGKSPQEDGTTLARLQSYCKNQITPYIPNFILIIMRMDDTRFHDAQSIFTQTLDRIATFKSSPAFGSHGNISNFVLLLTRLLSETPRTQKQPEDKVNLFKATISQLSSLSSDTQLLVGDNKGEEYSLPRENGFFKLPNKQLYPKNVLDAFVNVSTNLGDVIGRVSIQNFLRIRSSLNRYNVVSTHIFNENEFDIAQLVGQISMSNAGIKETQISARLQQALSRVGNADRAQAQSEIIQLQSQFQSMGLENVSQLPETKLEKVKFFQAIGLRSKVGYGLLNSAFGLKMTAYSRNLMVGNSYDAVQDEVWEDGPLISENDEESEIGYLIPDFVSCSHLPMEKDEKDYSYFVKELGSDYVPLRMSFIEIGLTQEKLNVTNFQGKLLSGFTLAPGVDEEVGQLSVCKEIRVMKCQLRNNYVLSSEFQDAVQALELYDESNRESVNSWNLFFRRFGTHIVTSVYGGGYVTGIVAGREIRSLVSDGSRISGVFNAMLNFLPVPYNVSAKPSYSFFGGVESTELSTQAEDGGLRNSFVFSNWTQSLKLDPVMLGYELKLEKISKYAEMVVDSGQVWMEVERALGIFMKQGLVYRYKRTKAPTNNKVVLTRPGQDDVGPGHNSDISSGHSPVINSGQNIFQNSNSSVTLQSFPDIQLTTSKPIFIPDNTYHYPTKHPVLESPTTASSFPINHYNNPAVTRELICPENPMKLTHLPIDYQETVVGQGYHVLKDVILSTSPLTPRKHKNISGTHLKGYDPVVFEKLDKPCEMAYSERFESFKDYALKKIGLGIAETNADHIVLLVPPNYPRHIQPGNVVAQGGNYFEYFPIYMETRTGKLSLNSSYEELLHSNSSFLRELANLQGLTSRSSCEQKREWATFFDKYGTHIILSAYTGEAFEKRLFDLDPGSIFSVQEKLKGNVCHALKSSKVKPIRKVIRSRFSMEFESLSRLINDLRERIKYDWAYRQLLRGNLDCSS